MSLNNMEIDLCEIYEVDITKQDESRTKSLIIKGLWRDLYRASNATARAVMDYESRRVWPEND